MVDIKRIIAVLCQHLNNLYSVDMKPEHFRLAKHDKTDNDVVVKFWKLLNKMTVESPTLSVNSVKQYFKSVDYCSDKFHGLPGDMSHGSRELLLAFSFILSKCLNSSIQQLLEVSVLDQSELFLSPAYKNTNLKINEFNNKNEYECYTRWLEGKIKQNQNRIIEYEAQNDKIINKMKDNAQLSVDSVTYFEILALNSTKYSRMFLENTEKLVSVLENHEKWFRVSHSFWRWMSSVLEQKKKKKGNAVSK